MFRFQSIFSLLLISFLNQTARGEVVEDVRYGPSCTPWTHSCQLILKIQGEITVADYEKIKRLIDETDREAKSKKWERDGTTVYLDTPGGQRRRSNGDWKTFEK